ncbi:DMT family transporter [Bremerella cremea]|nr:DMT family transporter [Bremerella cremea]
MSERNAPNLWLGMICGVLAAIGYSLTNICLRSLTGLDPIWVSFFKAIPTVTLFGPIAIWQVVTRRAALPSASSVGILIAAAISSQLLGNALLQWSFGVIGVAMSVPLCLGGMIVVGVFISKWFLQEHLTRWQTWGTGSLVLALVVLSMAGGGAVQSVVDEKSRWWLTAVGILAPISSGVSYAFLSIAIRRGVSREASMFMTTALICAIGMIILGPLSLITAGVEKIAQTTWPQYGVLLVAGLLNAGAFVALTLSFRYAPVIVGNAANSLQNPLSALAGVYLFHEADSINLKIGVALTVLGVVLMGLRDKPRSGENDRHAKNTHDGETESSPRTNSPVELETS